VNHAQQDGGSGSCLLHGEAGIGKTAVVSGSRVRSFGTRAKILLGSLRSVEYPPAARPLSTSADGLGATVPSSTRCALSGAGDFPARCSVRCLPELAHQFGPRYCMLRRCALGGQCDLWTYCAISRARIDQTPDTDISTYRDDESALTPAGHFFFGDLAGNRQTCHRMASAIDPAAVAAMAYRSVKSMADHPSSATPAGNPFFITEVLASPAGGLSRSRLRGRGARPDGTLAGTVPRGCRRGRGNRLGPAPIPLLAAILPDALAVLRSRIRWWDPAGAGPETVRVSSRSWRGWRLLRDPPLTASFEWHAQGLGDARAGVVHAYDLPALAYHAEESVTRPLSGRYAPQAARHAQLVGAHA